MNLLVLSRVSFPATNTYLPNWDVLRSLGHTVSIVSTATRPDAILCMSVSVMEETRAACKQWPGVPLFCYNWDCYSWVWMQPRAQEYNYHRYGDLLSQATEIWVPSLCTGRQTSLWWGLMNWRVIHPACPVWDYEDVRDDGFILCPLRALPDNWVGMFEQACEELKLPYRSPDHVLSRAEYQDTVASCRFIVSHYQEASTGGLTLLESYYLGKAVLLTNSEWNGAQEYFGTRATYFQHGHLDNFKHWLQRMYDNPRPVPEDHRAWVLNNFNDQRMATNIVERINAHIGTVQV